MVAPSPMWRVAALSAASSVIGSDRLAQEGCVPGFHTHPIGKKEMIELAALSDARDRLHHREAAARRIRGLPTPAGRMIAGAEHEHAEMHLTLRHCFALPRGLSSA